MYLLFYSIEIKVYMTEIKKGLVSVITVCYNAEKNLEETILSILNQTYSNIEYIIIDGGSSDGTVDIIKKYADRLAYWVSEPDKGIYDAMNKGIFQAKGEWIYFIGASDLLLKHSFQTIFSEKIGAEVIYGDITMVYPKGQKQIKKALSSSCLLYRMLTSHQAILMHTKVIKEHKGFNLDYKILADFDLMQRSYLSGVTFQYIPVSVAEFKFDGVSSKVSKEDVDFYRIMKSNKSIKYPMMCFIVLEIKRLIGFVYRKFILKQL